MDKQVFDIQPLKGMDIALSNEILRKYSKGAYEANRTTNFDPTRMKLDFEVTRGGCIKDINNDYPITMRMNDNLSRRNIIDPNEKYLLCNPPCKPRRRTLANIIIGGSRNIMRELAFGKQEVNYSIENHPDNSKVVREKNIEDWAVDVYNFISNEFGAENVLSFVVHLDETNPHAHCTVLPVVDNKISWSKFFHSDNKYNGIIYFRQLHSRFSEINKKYGLNRGEDVRETGVTHKSYTAYLKNENARLKERILLLEKVIRENGIAVG